MSACPWGVPVGPACAKLWSAQHVTTLHSQYLHAAHGNVSVIVMSNDVFNMGLEIFTISSSLERLERLESLESLESL